MLNQLFSIFGTIAINNQNANSALTDTCNRARQTALKMSTHFENMGKILDKVGQGFVTVGTRLTSTVTAGTVALATLGIKYNAQIQQYQTALTTLTGSAEEANRIIEQIRQDAARTPFDVAGLTQANQLLISTGLSAEESRETILALGDAVSATGRGKC